MTEELMTEPRPLSKEDIHRFPEAWAVRREELKAAYEWYLNAKNSAEEYFIFLEWAAENKQPVEPICRDFFHSWLFRKAFGAVME